MRRQGETGVLGIAVRAGAVGICLLALGTLLGFGPSVPGPPIRHWLGLAGTGGARPCEVRPDHIFSPTRPPAPSTPGWRPGPSSPSARTELEAITVHGRAYLIGGQGIGAEPVPDVITFDPATGRYGRAPKLPVALDHAGVAVDGDDIYVVGGYDKADPTKRAWRYSTTTRTWHELPSMRVARGALGVAVIRHRLYAVGGAPRIFPDEAHARPHAELEIYDIRTGRWQRGPSMPTARHHLAAAAVDGKLYVAGGRRPPEYSAADFERYDPRTERWQRLPPLPLGSGGLRGVAARGEFVVLGGGDERLLPAGGGWVTSSVWAFDPKVGKWRRLPELRKARHGFGAVVVNGRLFAFEGSPCPGYGRTSAVESLSLRALPAQH